ncbi:carboxypeptidase-like regulatory domain-containing protein [Imperialibacter roseus]|uniref:Carboxypeptidase-like regulatory domain-containing protein n=1 Tax=Imperialibacter roseus TaxID=1324217 RepID=A0ABZ0IPY8_9BACT|nr:carboxypeptidase-like regulatory domain-containing protein [Imperialibacter roseus]WOK05781.1 carboxypeptidase-like regulatory domain-containing protein [Imperialibacter roseus]
MKTIKLNFLLVIMALGVFTFTSCEDEFTEEDFFDKQAELAATKHGYDLEKLILQYELSRANDSLMRVFQTQLTDAINDENAEALRQAGLLSSYTLTVENQGGTPIEGATISLAGSNAAAGRVDAVTDATGQAIFTDVVIGDNPVQISAPGFVGVSYILQLGSINNGTDYLLINSKVYPLGRSETSRITLLSADGASGTFATINGTATIETDVTNETSEVPQDVTIIAYLNGTAFSGGGVGGFYNGSASLGDFRFIGEGVGSAVVDNATGAWSMLLPATESGISYTLQAPTLTANQAIVIDTRNGKSITPELASVPTRFGANVNESPAVAISGARAVFPAPTGAGNGANLTFAPFARDINFTLDIDGNTGTDNVNNIEFDIRSEGGTFQTSPTAAITTATAPTTAAVLTTSLLGDLDLTVSGGVGYTIGEDYDITINVLAGATVLGTVTVTETAVDDGAGNGVLPAITEAGNFLLDDDDDDVNFFGITGYSVTVTEVAPAVAPTTAATITVTCDCVVDQVQTSTTGVGYTTAISGITFSGGGGTAFPIVAVLGTGFQYSVAIDNTGITVPYTIFPEFGWYLSSISDPLDDFDSDVSFTEAGSGLTGEDFNDLVGIDGSGNIVLTRTVTNLRTDISYRAPVVEVVEPTAMIAFADVEIDDNGHVIDLFNVDEGSGYNVIFGVTITPTLATSPGTGAAVLLSNFSILSTGEVEWNGDYTITDEGSGYLQELNPGFNDGVINFSTTTTINAVSGSVFDVKLIYGTGERLEDVNQ